MIKGQKAIQFSFCNLLHLTCATEVLYSFDSYVALNKFSLFTKAIFTIFSACVDLVLYYWTTSAFLGFCHRVVLVMLTFWCFISIQSTKCISVIWRPVVVFFVVIGCCELTGSMERNAIRFLMVQLIPNMCVCLLLEGHRRTWENQQISGPKVSGDRCVLYCRASKMPVQWPF